MEYGGGAHETEVFGRAGAGLPACWPSCPAAPARELSRAAGENPDCVLPRGRDRRAGPADRAELSEKWGQQVVVVNRPGGGGNIGARPRRRAARRLHARTSAHGRSAPTSRSLRPPVPSGHAFRAHRARSAPRWNLHGRPTRRRSARVKEVVDYAGPILTSSTIASVGIGTARHLAHGAFKTMARRRDRQHVPYKGNVPAIADIFSRPDARSSVHHRGRFVAAREIRQGARPRTSARCAPAVAGTPDRRSSRHAT